MRRLLERLQLRERWLAWQEDREDRAFNRWLDALIAEERRTQ